MTKMSQQNVVKTSQEMAASLSKGTARSSARQNWMDFVTCAGDLALSIFFESDCNRLHRGPKGGRL